mgnify:FL=1
MKRFSIFAIIIALCFSAQAETVIHRMHVWKDGHSVNYLIDNEIDSITFSSEVLTLELTEDFVNLRVGDQHQLTANVPVSSWSSSEESVATITQNGLVTAIAEGYAVITATADGVTQTCIIQVSPKDYITEDGCYVIGEASPIKSIYDQNAMLAQMAIGINEVWKDQDGRPWEESKRDGMWEKYIWLEANKDFEIVLKEGENITTYGANLEKTILLTDMGEQEYDKGSPIIGQKMQVAESGLYHIILDFGYGGWPTTNPQIIIAPVYWGVCGGMNGWGMTAAEPDIKSTTDIVWTWTNQVVEYGELRFYFRDAKSGWKIYLDENGDVRAYTSLGENGRNGGSDIYVESCGIYTIKLIYNLASGDIENSYRYEIVKTGESLIDPSDIVYSFIGTINGNWDTDTDFTFKSKQGDHYVFELNNLDFPAGEFKIRVNHDWSGSFGYYNMVVKGVEVYGSEGNIALPAPFKGSAILEFDWDNCFRENNIILTFYPQ